MVCAEPEIPEVKAKVVSPLTADYADYADYTDNSFLCGKRGCSFLRVGLKLAGLLACLVTAPSQGWGGGATNALLQRARSFSYTNDVVPAGPWSIHIARIERSHPDFQFCTTSGKGDFLGMSTVAEQVKTLPPELGQPMAAINGDFYEKSEEYEGRPRDIQIRRGELISRPAEHTAFWIDRQGNPQMTNVYSRFRVVWPGAKTHAIGLNEDRRDDAAVLYTGVVGHSTRTRGGLELALECATDTPLPLRAGKVYDARVRALSTNGNTPVDRQTVVLSIGPKLMSEVPAIKPGAILKIITETVPDLSGVEVAIGGGPALIRDSKVMQWHGFLHMRHPRSALGWNKDYIFLVEVDGRQIDLSVGMTFPELADYMMKLGCQQAMNFDGGGSATLWALGDVRNSPSEGQERPAANALVVVRKNSRQAAR
jgi:hypothetical protein